MRVKLRHVLAGFCGVYVSACGSEAPSRWLALGETTQALSRPATSESPAYTLFEALQTRPLALSPNGRLLFALNTQDDRLEIFALDSKAPRAIGSVQVGLQPVALAARADGEVWVVNHVSDSVSVVRLDDDGAGRVERTLYVGDEPRDIVFAGPDRRRAFITTAHRGQSSPDDPDLFNPASGRADVWVFDAQQLGDAAGGERLTKITLFADTPRALAVSADGSEVYAAPFFSGNRSTIASADAVRHVYADHVDPDNPNLFWSGGAAQPITGRIVKRKPGADGAEHWYDDLGTSFDDWIRVSLPDHDVFAIDALANPPQARPERVFAGVGTTLFNMAVNPKRAKIYVSNTDAHNDVRFEGHDGSGGFTSVRGDAVDSRISVIDPVRGTLVHNDLNSSPLTGKGGATRSLAFPQDLAVSSDGQRLLVVAQGSAKLAVYETAVLDAGRATQRHGRQIRLSAGGPSGVVLDERRQRAYVLTRFDNGISTIDLRKYEESAHLTMFDPEPPRVRAGRPFLYDASNGSENGTQACASCHVGGDLDGLAWDLGDPGGRRLAITRSAASETEIWTFPPSIIVGQLPQTAGVFESFASLKGPMTTQSLRGLANHGSMHWRGDRNGAIRQDGTPFTDERSGEVVLSAQPDSGIYDERRAFTSFNVAFTGLVGRAEPLPPSDMEAFADFALELSYPPNPIRNLDDSLTPLQQAGRNVYFQTDASGAELPVDRLHNCNGCHTLDRGGNAGATPHPGFFGSSGRMSFENLPQAFKVAHFRNAYQKVGMFASSPDDNRSLTPLLAFNPPLLAVRGFGYQPDGAVGSLEQHLTGRSFIRTDLPIPAIGPNPGGLPTFLFDAAGNVLGIDPAGFAARRALASFLLAYDSNLRPIVGQQLTLDASSAPSGSARLELLRQRAEAGDCDLIAKGSSREREQGYLYEAGSFRLDSWGPALDVEALLDLLGAELASLTFTCAPPGSGYRMGVDRDQDGSLDGDEIAAGSDPASSESLPQY